MKLKSLSVCRYPTTVMMVDDNPRFLTHLSARLDPSFHFMLVNDPREALPLSAEEGLLKQTLQSCFIDEEPGEHFELEGGASFQQYSQGICLNNLLKLPKNPERFDEVSVIVVDYAMPGMNGIELCRALAKHPAKKILLTGEADHRIAVDAFNEGLIHRFILKQTQENLLYEELNASIREMQNIYFSVNSRKLLSALGIDALMASASFTALMAQLLEENNDIEFYLLNSRGAFLLLDESGKAEVLVCESAKNLESYAEMARDNGASEFLIHSLTQKTHLPYLLTAKNEDLPFSQWDQNLIPAEPFENGEFFWGMSKILPYGFDFKNVASYAAFMEEHLKHEGSFK